MIENNLKTIYVKNDKKPETLGQWVMHCRLKKGKTIKIPSLGIQIKQGEPIKECTCSKCLFPCDK